MVEKYIPLIVAGVFALFIIFGLLWGLIRGLKRTAFRAGWIVVIALICFFVAPLLTKWVMTMRLPAMNVGDGVTCNTLTELATYYLGQIKYILFLYLIVFDNQLYIYFVDTYQEYIFP